MISNTSNVRLDVVDPAFVPGGRLYESFKVHVATQFDIDCDRNDGRLFFPGDCLALIGKTEEETFDIYAPSDPREIVGSEDMGRYAGEIRSGESVIVLSAFRDDQSPVVKHGEPYPVLSMIVLTSQGVGWLFVSLMDSLLKSIKLISSTSECKR